MREFVDFAMSNGVIIKRLAADGKIHRVPTVGHPKSRNGAYRFDGQFGWVQAWDTSEKVDFYRPEGKPSPEQLERSRRFAAAEREDREHGYEEAARLSREVIARCQYTDHPYFARKGLHGLQGLVDPNPVLMRRGEEWVETAGCLVVPMRFFRSSNDLRSVQWIDDTGGKRFMTNGRAEGAVFSMGPQMADAWAVEGYATGLSVMEALKRLYRQDRVVVCFSAHNLKVIAPQLGPRTRVVADNDAPDKMGRRAGQEAAEATGLPWVMPYDTGTDANDLHVEKGLQALVNLLREIL